MLLLEWLMVVGWLWFSSVYLILSIWTSTGEPERHGNLSGIHAANTTFPIVCYFDMVHDLPANVTIHPALNATLCTHIIFIALTIKDNQIVVSDARDVSTYFAKIPYLKRKNPSLKVMVSSGGGSYAGFSTVLASASNRTTFVKSAVPFLRKYRLDGLDLDWEFPGWPPHPPGQRRNFTLLIQELRKEFDGEVVPPGRSRLELSAAVAAGRSVMAIYDIRALSKLSGSVTAIVSSRLVMVIHVYVAVTREMRPMGFVTSVDPDQPVHQTLDFVNLMCYDYHSYKFPFDPVTGYNAPLYPTDWAKKIVLTAGNTGWSSHEWMKRGMPKEKIMVGVPTYTHTWTLEMPDKFHDRHAPATGPGKTCDECSYSWVCNFLKNGAKDVFDADAAVPYCYHGNQWVSYDNENSLHIKAKWILENGFGGIMVYSMNNDDYLGTCDNKTRFPLLSAIHNAVRQKRSNTVL